MISFLIPLIGFVIGIVYYSKPDASSKKVGKNCLIIAVIVPILYIAFIVISAVLYVWAASFLEQGEASPLITFTSSETSSGEYQVTVIKVSSQIELVEFSYFLKAPERTTSDFGEVAMQNLSGNVVGIDIQYEYTCGDYCDVYLKEHSDAVENDDGSNYAVAFNDKDRDGKLSAGDKFTCHGSGNSANGPADDDWTLEVKYDNTGDVIGSIQLG